MKRPSLLPPARLGITPLIDVAFLVLIFFMALPMKRLAFKMETHLPKNDGIVDTPSTPPPDVIRLRLRLRGDAVSYAVGGHTFDRAAGLTPVLRQLGPLNHYEIHASADVPWEAVVGTVDVLAALEFTKVRFRGTREPTRELRRSVPLPRPG
ncbi:MAG: ExbD/TolR family protein [Planctomycetota bacterium]|jgi:biopolymer transport protein ExbD